ATPSGGASGGRAEKEKTLRRSTESAPAFESGSADRRMWPAAGNAPRPAPRGAPPDAAAPADRQETDRAVLAAAVRARRARGGAASSASSRRLSRRPVRFGRYEWSRRLRARRPRRRPNRSLRNRD